ncbi:PAS domain S-box-containing protein/TyrR family helix-turn-helix domain-containing protein [Desulfuromusa kysingii]|uniref:HTH-type transcriptional regulatory protein TyrR n=2 Tax=Desulfuromusa kysingii TaxID=37625 RepID=A0A1H4E097_9BACT|nr:PAS domain S-box-containing protein/TyrR family helix-turn-helix domain-containing protein [Desulfuromusa kysingii]
MPIPKIPPLPSHKTEQWSSPPQMFQDLSVAGILVTDKAGIVLSSQGFARKILRVKKGIPLEQALPQLWPKVKRTLQDLKRRQEESISIETEVNFLTWIEPIVYDSICDGIICFFIEHLKIPELLSQLSSFQDLTGVLNTIIDSSADGLWVSDSQGIIIRINPASERISDVKAEDIIGRSTQELIDLGIIKRSVFEEVINSKKVVSYLTQSANGRKFIATGTPVFDVSGDVVRVVVSERDVSEIDRLQRELEEQEAIKDEFRHKIAEMQQTNLSSQQVIAKSPCMVKALSQAIRVSNVDSSVLILGESGVGKGLFADLIHKNSRRAEKPIIKINCGAIPESLIEAELFGYEKGAFTGAQAQKPGHFEFADGGTLFLDEIAELPLSAQVKLLHFLEDGQITRVGGTTGRTVDVRVLAATHRNLEEMVENKSFRLDLYYRLNVIPIYVPSVRERKDCVLPLLRYYLDFYAEKVGCKRRLSLAATDALLSYKFPGNVRQLMNICERLVVMSETELVDLQDLPSDVFSSQKKQGRSSAVQLPENIALREAIEKVERSILKRSYAKHRNQYKMAALLGVTQATIARKLKKYGISKHVDYE